MMLPRALRHVISLSTQHPSTATSVGVERRGSASVRTRAATNRKTKGANGQALPRPYTTFVVDQPDGIAAIRRVLTRIGLRVLGLASGDSALRKALASPPSMFIMEAALPRENG